VFVHRLRVRFHECDPQGVVFNAHYFSYFDVALTEMWRAAFGSYAKVVTAFNGTTPALTVGTDLGVAANILGAADITEGTPGAYGPIAAGSALTITAPTPIYAKLVAAGVSTGEAVIVIPFVPDDDG
jgi:hypothetical protein